MAPGGEPLNLSYCSASARLCPTSQAVLTQVIEWSGESGDGESIKREHPCTVFRSMPHYNDWTFHPKAQLCKERAGFTPVANRNGTANAADGADILTGTFDTLNETTDDRPAKGESTSIVHPAFKTGAEGIDRSIKGIHNVYFEDIGSGDQDNNDVVIGVRENIGTNSGPDGSSFMTETFEPMEARTSFAGTFNLTQGDLPHEGEPFQPAPGIDSFGKSINPVVELGTNSGPGGSIF